MERIPVSVYNIVGNSFCVDAEDGQKVYDMIEKIIKQNKPVLISFKNIEMLTSAFLNTAIGQLYRDFDEEIVKTNVSAEDLQNEDKALLKRVIDTAKLYYKDPEKMERTINEIIGD